MRNLLWIAVICALSGWIISYWQDQQLIKTLKNVQYIHVSPWEYYYAEKDKIQFIDNRKIKFTDIHGKEVSVQDIFTIRSY